MKRYLLWSFLLCANCLQSQEAVNVKFKDATDQELELEDFRGQVVYLSFWASWCGACKHNFYKYKEVRRKLLDMGVVLLNVSMDKDRTHWLEALEKQDIIGHHFIVENYDQVMMDYQITSLPRYEIINKNGRLVYLSEKSNRDIFKDFEKWLLEIP